MELREKAFDCEGKKDFMKNIVILGGGYGGLTVVTELLDKDLPDDTEIILVDRMPFQGLKTEYYALASGTLSDIDIRAPFPKDPRLHLKFAEISEIHLENKQVHFEDGDSVIYDILIISLGCIDNYHGIPGAALFTNSIQTFSSTRRTYQQINDIKPYGQVTIVGSGLSGVEMASELRESRTDLNIRIIDRGSSVLSAFPEKLQVYVKSWFTENHVEMKMNVSLSAVEQYKLYNKNEIINTDVTLWTAGIQPSPVVQKLALTKDPQGRIIINEYHQIPAYPDVYVVGDCASLPFSPSGQLAEAQGKQVAEVIQAQWEGKIPKLGQIKLKGVLGSLGKKNGFGLMGGRTLVLGRVPRLLKSGVLWMSKHHLG